MREVTVVANPAAGGGRGRAALPRAVAALRAGGTSVTVVESRDLDHAVDMAGQAAAAGQVVAALGGDGTVGAVAGAVAGMGGLLAVLPAGRGNDFARTLGVPLEAAAAARAMTNAVERRVDLGSAGGRTFVGIASVGFDSETNRVANDSRLIRGRLVYPYAVLRVLRGWRPAGFEVTVDGVTCAFTGYLVSVANIASYGGGMRIAPHADPTDGLLDVITARHMSKARFLTVAPKIFSGRHVTHPCVTEQRGRGVRLDADRPFIVYADGDPLCALPTTVTVLPGALRVLAPGLIDRTAFCGRHAAEDPTEHISERIPEPIPDTKDHRDAG